MTQQAFLLRQKLHLPVGEMIILVKSNEGHLRPSPSTARKKVSLQASNDLFFYKTNNFFFKIQ